MAFIEGTNGNDNLSGTDDHDFMSGLDGNDTLHGLGGNDDLRGWGGDDFVFGDDGDDFLWAIGHDDDVLDGGAGSDWVIYTSVGHGVRVNLEFGTGRAIDPNIPHNDTLIGIENILGGRHDDHLQGDTANNEIDGNSGADVILGWEGDDNLLGGPGADTIDGGEGNDTINGNDFFDNEFFNGNEGFDFLDLRSADVRMFVSLQSNVSHTLKSASVDVDSIFNFEGVIGSEFRDVMDGDANDNWLQGNEDNDRLEGGAGFDTLDGGGSSDRIFWQDGDGNDRVDGGFGSDTQFVVASGNAEKFTLLTFFSGPAYVLGMEGGLSGDAALLVDGIEFLEVRALGGDDAFTLEDISATSLTGSIRYIAGAGNDSLAGSLAAIAIEAVGQAGRDNLEAGAGNDSLAGGVGFDTLIGNGGADELIGSAGKDRLTGGTEADTFKFNATAESAPSSASRDVITDFEIGADEIDLAAIDANTNLAGKQNFTFKAGGFTGVAGQVIVQSGATTFVRADVDGDAVQDMTIELTGNHALTAGDFLFI